MPQGQRIALPEKPCVGSSNVGAAVTGTAAGPGHAGVSGSSIPPVVTGPVVTGYGAGPQFGDGVFGTGLNGVHGTSTYADLLGKTSGNGVLGEHTSTGCGVAGTSVTGTGVHGTNGAGSGTTPKYGCGVRGESDGGYGLYGASKTASGVYATSGPNQLAGEFAGNVSVTGDIDVAGAVTAANGVKGETTSTTSSGVSGLNNLANCSGVSGSSNAGHGVHGINGSGSGTKPVWGCGVWGESASGYGVYGASTSGVAGHFAGNVTVTGTIHVSVDVILGPGGADCAEQFDLRPLETADPGTVMVIDDLGALRQSDTAYDRKVAGVVSGAGGFRPGIVLDGSAEREGRAIIALVGKVYCKVDADAGSITVGDLLTTSSTPGHAMRVADPLQGFGCVIGKALRPLADGKGLIPVLVALQ